MRKLTSRTQNTLAALIWSDCVQAVSDASLAFANATNLPPKFTSRSWFLNEFARRLGKGQQLPGRRGWPALQVQTELSSTYLGNFRRLVDSPLDPPIDLLACPPWGRLALSDEDYGTDETFLPAFYAFKLSFNRDRDWEFPEYLANKIPGPLTVSIVYINLFGPEQAFHAAEHFERSMKAKEVAHHVSTHFMIPGILASVTSAEPADPFQVLIASQSFERDPIRNPDFGRVSE